MTSSAHVAVVGAGIIGSSIAVNLARKGCRVTVLETGSSAAEGATAKSWAWLNANRKTPAHYKDLNKAGIEEWRSLKQQTERGDVLADFPGTIYIGDSRELDPKYPSQCLRGKDIAQLEPEIAGNYAERGGRLYEQEGYGYPALAAAQFLEEARELNAEVSFSTKVIGFTREGQRVKAVQTAEVSYEPDFVVLAAGLETPALAEKLGAHVPLQDKEGTLTVLTQPMPRMLQHIVVTDEAFILQRRDGEFMISFFKAAVNHSPVAGGAMPPAQGSVADRDSEEITEHIRESVHESAEGHRHEAAEHLNASDAIAQREIGRAAAICPVLKDTSLGSFSVAKYPYPADAHPILGWLPGAENVYVAVTHSGATLGPYLGRLVAAEVVGEHQPILDPYRPNRDFADMSNLY